MSETISLAEFVYAVKAEAARHVHHPAGRQVIREWIEKMFQAASTNNGAEVARLTKLVRRRVRMERLGRLEDWLVFRSKHHPRLRRRVHAEIEAAIPDPYLAWIAAA